jgi:hypothetical protein
MAAVAILGPKQDGRRHLEKPTKRSNSDIYEPIFMKFDTQMQINMPNTKNLKNP